MQGNDTFRLVVRRGPQPNQTYDITKDVTTLGRDITNDIVINDPEVSRHHLRIARTADGCSLEDLGSTNGTFVNGQRISGSRPLNNGDMIGLGETVTLGYERLRPSQMGGFESGASPMAPTVPVPSNQGNYAPYNPAPPQQQIQPQQNYSPYAPQQQPQQNMQSNYGYSGQANDPLANPYGAQGYATQQPAVSTGYDYDPYAVREEEPRNAMRWAAIGCGGLAVFCCCSTVVGLVVIDSLNLWYSVPIVRDIAPILARLFGT
jgi:pSer/pThr/pTyr-binding forkhead associated (FHA) protein